MEIFDSILGNAADAEWKARLEGAQVDWLELSQWDAQKNRFRRKTAGGRTMAVALERGHSLHDGDILDWDEETRRAVVCRIRLCPVMAVEMAGLAALPAEEALASAVRLGHALGNQHWPMVVMGGMGSITGSIAGAFVVTFISAALASFPEARMIIYALALILMMFYRPQGLFGYMELTNVSPIKKFLDKVSSAKEAAT